MRKNRLQVITLGCSKNTVDTEHLLAMVGDRMEIVPEEDSASRVDYLLLNTCGFIGDAKEESVNAILSAVVRKNEGKVGKLIVFGCLSQRYMSELPDLIPEVDAWFGARDLAPVARELGVEPSDEVLRVGSGRPYAYLKISEGCERKCSYCAIPLIRGSHRSVPIETLVRETEQLVRGGVKEIIIIAQDSTYYGLDLYHRRSLSDLLRAISAVEGVEWIRIHYSYPASFPEDVLALMASDPKICPYLDIPLQHIADPVLSAMRRGVDSASTRELISRMRAKVPGVVLRTTMMVGHPGEGEAEFRELLDFVKEARFERLGAFVYSEEEGTWGASNLEDAVGEDVKKARLDELMNVQREISLEFNRSRVGTVERVLVDEVRDSECICRSRYESPEVDGEILVRNAASVKQGDFLEVRIVEADDYDLIAEPV